MKRGNLSQWARALFVIALLVLAGGVRLALCTSSRNFILHDEYDLADLEYEKRVLNAAETSLAKYLSMGYKNPVNLSDPEYINEYNKIDIYVRDLPESADGRKVYGSTELEGKNGYSYIEVTNDAGEQLEFAVAHEVFHTIQDAYDIHERRHPWIEEGTAELMAGRLYNATSEYRLRNWENYLLNYPEKSLFSRTYDATLFWLYISQTYGDSKILEIWQISSSDSLNGFEGVKKALPNFDADFANFSEWLYLNYLKNQGELTHYYAGNYSELSAGNIEPYGARYIEINNTAPASDKIKSGNLSISFEKKSSKTTFHIRLLKYEGDTLEQIYEAMLSGSNKKRAIEIPNTQNCSKAIFIISRLDRNPSDSGELSLKLEEKPAAAPNTEKSPEKSMDGFEIPAAMFAAIIVFLKKDKLKSNFFL